MVWDMKSCFAPTNTVESDGRSSNREEGLFSFWPDVAVLVPFGGWMNSGA
jgi:hypothetical protein